jgi:hypothetical protein
VWEKFANVDRRWIYALMIFVIALALLRPIGLAIIPSADTQKVYDIVEALPPGSIVWMGMEFSAGGIPELMPALQSMIRQGFKEGRDLRFVCGGLWQMAGDMADQAFSIVEKEFPNKKYGVDWVNIGYRPGGEVLLQQYLDNIIKTAQGVDFYGNDLNTLPLLKEFPNLKAAKLVTIFCTGTPGEKEYIKHVTSPNNLPLVEAAISVSIPECMPLVQAGQISGLVAGMKGAAEYEVLVGSPGTATAGMDAQSFSHALIIIFMILGNIGYIVTKKKKTS